MLYLYFYKKKVTELFKVKLKRGLGRSSERAKMHKIRRCGATFTKLGACASDHKEGV